MTSPPAPVLVTVHGSHLYGLNHEGSDLDLYVVLPSWNRTRKNDSRQSIRDGVDRQTVGLSTWLRFCEEGNPQALEAMFSPVATVDLLADYRRTFVVNPVKMRRTYLRTARNFSASIDPKKQRHALRLLINLAEAQQSGRFNPRLSPEQVERLDTLMLAPAKAFELLAEPY